MPYAQAWNESSPNGATAPANTLDTIIRDEVKIAVRERMVSLGATLWASADPVAFSLLRMVGATPYIIGGSSRVIEWRLADGVTIVGYIDISGNLVILNTMSAAVLSAITLALSGNATIGGNAAITGTLGLTGALTANAATFNDNVEVVAAQAGSRFFNAGNSATAIVLNWDNGNNQLVTLTGNAAITFSNPKNFPYLIKLKQDGTGSRVPTFPANWIWAGGVAPTFTTTANRSDIITAIYDGTNYLANVYGYNFNG